MISRRLVLSPENLRNHVATLLAEPAVSDRAAAVVPAREQAPGLDG